MTVSSVPNMVVTKTPSVATVTNAGDPITYTGTLTGYTMPDHDSDSSDKAMFTLEVSADEPIS